MSTLTHPLQHISGNDYDRRLRRSRRHCHYWRQNNHQSPPDDIDGLAREEELAKLVEHIDKASTAYGMEISAEKKKLMTNNTSGINKEIKVNGQKLEAVTSLTRVPNLRYSPGKCRQQQDTDTVDTSLERQELFSRFQDTTDALPCHIHLPVCLWTMDPHSRAPKKNTSHGNEVLPQDTTHLIQRP